MYRKPLTEAQIELVRQLRTLNPSRTVRQIAKQTGVSLASVHKIVSGTYGVLKVNRKLSIGERCHARDYFSLVNKHAQEIKDYKRSWEMGWTTMLRRHEEEIAALWESYQVGKPRRNRGESLADYRSRLAASPSID